MNDELQKMILVKKAELQALLEQDQKAINNRIEELECQMKAANDHITELERQTDDLYLAKAMLYRRIQELEW